MQKTYFLIALLILVLHVSLQAQKKLQLPSRGLSFYAAKDSSASVRMITLMQFWARYQELNEGTVYKNQQRSQAFDLSIRRFSFIPVFQISPRLLMLFNVTGISNAGNAPNQPSLSLSFTDAYAEYKFSDKLFIGAGLSQWTGLSRLTVDGVATLINADLPAFQYPLLNRLDRISRSIGIYAKGRLAKLNYRLMLADPFTPPAQTQAANTGGGSPSGGILKAPAGNAQVQVAYLNPAAIAPLLQGYAQWEFLDKEPNIIPFENNTYFGTKRIFNLGGGFMWRSKGVLTPENISLQDASQPASSNNPLIVQEAAVSDFKAFALDLFLDYRLSPKLDGIVAYAGFFMIDLGKNYYTIAGNQNIGAANPNRLPGISGAGNGLPATGTGNSFYSQLGYLAPKGFISEANRFGIFATYQYSDFEALAEAVQIYETGLNWFIAGNGLKCTLQYRNRPEFEGEAAFGEVASTARVARRKSEMILQVQMSF
jgi:hypothetical protein